MRVIFALTVVVSLLGITADALFAQNDNCKFLNESCAGPEGRSHSTPPSDLTKEEHLKRCLADFERRQGGFVPEGHSTRSVKSRSDATAMCLFAIERRNYYWSYPANPDQTANMRCCMNMGSDEKTCRANIEAAKRSNLHMDFCYFASRANDPPPADWKVPPGCKGGPCMITTGYCQSVGYTKMDSGSREFFIRQLWANLTKYPQTADTTRAVLRVCFGRT